MRTSVRSGAGLVLRRWGAADAAAVRGAFDEPQMRQQSREPVECDASAARWIEDRVREWDEGSGFAFAVVDRDGGVVGNMAVGSVNRAHRVGWVSYWTTAAARGRGVAAEACRTVSEWAFRDAELFRLEIGHRTNNTASCRVALAAGYAVEGWQRQKLEYDGVRHDVELHARLATDAAPSATHRRPRPA
ncbi:GNAT family N-acetyltransferase [Streptomyces sp. XM4193]|uniref:GNAT family N-acetyltransferase n=1 Tax=Streptomyces sp. XM4193 TaxID=2929782 RepID=UPI001FFBABF3|nr:GNAT family protein [Streptomyces sp. XM4193]MCK1796900.1 GNAT family N-acetyltransferase [Streptomyces sp. XM4193]